jgi:two-component system sensor histidine kinase QseC
MSSSKPAPAWSIRRRLGWQLTLVMGVMMAGLFAMLDHNIDQEMYARLDRFLASRAGALSEQLQIRTPEETARLLPEYDLTGHTDFFTLYDARHRPILRSPNSGGEVLPLPGGTWHPPVFYDLELPDLHVGRAIVLSVPRADAQDPHWLVVATERETWDQIEQRLHLLLLAVFLSGIAVMVTLSILLVRRAFSPLIAGGARLAALHPSEPPPELADGLPRELTPYADALHAALQRLYAAAQRERRMSRNLAHELRTPVAEIRTAAENALAADNLDACRTGLTATLSATARMERGINTLLALARYESGQETLARDPVDLVQLLRQQVNCILPPPGPQGPPRLASLPAEAWVHSDVGILERILANLLQNAVEYAPADSRVECGIDAGDSGYMLWIRNLAPLLADEDLAYLGTRYWRKDDQGATANHAGLGLALAQAAARALGTELTFGLEGGWLTVRLGPMAAL